MSVCRCFSFTKGPFSGSSRWFSVRCTHHCGAKISSCQQKLLSLRHTQPMNPAKKSLNFIFPTKYVIPKSWKSLATGWVRHLKVISPLAKSHCKLSQPSGAFSPWYGWSDKKWIENAVGSSCCWNKRRHWWGVAHPKISSKIFFWGVLLEKKTLSTTCFFFWVSGSQGLRFLNGGLGFPPKGILRFQDFWSSITWICLLDAHGKSDPKNIRTQMVGFFMVIYLMGSNP